MLAFRILYKDEALVAIDKPAGFHSHPPEDKSIRLQHRWNAQGVLQNQLGRPLFPIHRLDRSHGRRRRQRPHPSSKFLYRRRFRNQKNQKKRTPLSSRFARCRVCFPSLVFARTGHAAGSTSKMCR